MGRNKYPEQTVEKIIITAARLFSEKGYEQTSIQDILDALKLSKGGLYHHFKSKEDIMDALIKRQTDAIFLGAKKRAQYVFDSFHELIRNTKAENAKEKLKKILLQLVDDSETHMFDKVLSSQVNPYFVVGSMQASMQQDAPTLCELIKEGIRDGSLQTTQPALCSEVFLILLNYWANPVLFGRNCAETKERLNYLQFVMRQLGLDILDDNIIASLAEAYG